MQLILFDVCTRYQVWITSSASKELAAILKGEAHMEAFLSELGADLEDLCLHNDIVYRRPDRFEPVKGTDNRLISITYRRRKGVGNKRILVAREYKDALILTAFEEKRGRDDYNRASRNAFQRLRLALIEGDENND